MSRPGRYLPPQRPGTQRTGGWVGPRAGLDRCGKSNPTGIRFPDRPARSQSLYQLSYTGPRKNKRMEQIPYSGAAHTDKSGFKRSVFHAKVKPVVGNSQCDFQYENSQMHPPSFKQLHCKLKRRCLKLKELLATQTCIFALLQFEYRSQLHTTVSCCMKLTA